jgi:signal transduction histidine kinase
MTVKPPFLAVPISVRVSADGILLSADPPVWQLHVLAGGQADGPIAIPGLAALAALTLRTKIRVERPVRVAGEEQDAELWVQAMAEDEVAALSIIGWRDITPSSIGFGLDKCAEVSSAALKTIAIDPDLRLVRLPAGFSTTAIGQHLGAIFILEGDSEGRIPFVDALIEQRPIKDTTIAVAGRETRYTINLTPQFGGDGAYLGHVGQALEVIMPAQAEMTQDLPMGRQFASVLKQPLSRILANAETIGSLMHGPLRENYAEYAHDIANAARHLSELVNDMEDLEAIDRPDFSVAKDRIELGDIARRVAGLLALKASDHGISLDLPTEDEAVEAFGEFRRVLQILLNLVGNAIRYAPDGSAVQIKIEKRGDFGIISVSDEGEGIPIADRERVFEKFERLGRSGDGGSGLGLYISRRLAHAMGGELMVEDAPTGGACFRLTLPAR